MSTDLWWALVLVGLFLYLPSWWKFHKLRLMLRHVPKVEAEILWARLRYRRSFEEIGNELGLTRQYVDYRYERGMERLTYLREHL